ncbi:PEP-CTERM sorting domain-containing protein [Paludibaculum fermentans]|uniref:PEP-CTERM sorting domain-containing protein n=1 Tax=Paludibaculum fermentans TaxID=1473598 RepID=A0A7S7SK70_PALFE|nr:PEP-CTERM sorting domain-containing protein [Paludibaculum fermentans]QOY87458.1 PEP-CTERM sorting domain-containing protein [Paludibaculum fermentans]
MRLLTKSTPAQLMMQLAAFLVVTAGMAQAIPIYGTISLGGTAEVTQTTIDFAPFVPGAAVDGTGQVVATGPGAGAFSPLVFGDQGAIVDRTVAGGIVPPQPAGVPIFVLNWLTFTNGAFRYALDLTFIDIGAYGSADCTTAPANGQTCTPSAPAPFQSPYSLSNFFDSTSGLSSNANFSVRGFMRNLDTGLNDYAFNGVFGAEFLGQPYQSVLATVTAGGSVVASYSATINATAIPEPSTGLLTLLGAGFVAFGVMRRRRNRA